MPLRDLLIGLLLDWIPNRGRPSHREHRDGCGVCSDSGRKYDDDDDIDGETDPPPPGWG